MSSIGRKAFIAEQIQFLKSQIEETASIVENLRRNGGVVPWETEGAQKTTLQLLEEQLRDERQLLTDWDGLLHARSRRCFSNGPSYCARRMS